MKFSNVILHSFTHYDPPCWLTSDEIETELSTLYNQLHLPYGRLQMQTGIERRGYWPLGTLPSDIASSAASQLLERYDQNPDGIDLLINASVCHDYLEPATSANIHRNLKLPSRCLNFDLTNACLGSMSALLVAASMIEAKQIQKALIVVGENSAPLIFHTLEQLKNKRLNRKEIKPYFASLTIGSVATAFIVSHKDDLPHSSFCSLLTAQSLAATDQSCLCYGSGDLNAMQMQTNSEELLTQGVSLAKKTFDLFINHNCAFENYHSVFSHQVGQAHQSAIFNALGLDLAKDQKLYPSYGNTGPAAVFLAMSHYVQNQQIQESQYSLALGIGSGLNCTIAGLQWH